MLVFKLFSFVMPHSEFQKKIASIKSAALFLESENGFDWYECQSEFSDDTIKIMYDERGIIRGISSDVSALWPVNFSVAEIAPGDVPGELNNSGEWMFDGAVIHPRVYTNEELIQQSDRERNYRLASLAAEIDNLQDASDTGSATPEQQARLLALKRHRMQLREMKLQPPDRMRWPVLSA